MILEPGCRIPIAAFEKQKCSEGCKGPKPRHFSSSAGSLGMQAGMGEIRSHKGSGYCSLDFFNFRSNWRLKTSDEFGPE